MKTPFFSIVIPTYNEEYFLPRLLRSLEKQTFKDFEVIIADCKSMDKTKDRALAFQQKLPSLRFYTTRKANVSYQRNFGARKALGRYLIFFDADYTLHEKHLRQIYTLIQKKSFQLASTWLIPDTKEIPYVLYLFFLNVQTDVTANTGLTRLPGGNIIVKKTTFDKIGGFKTNIALLEDQEFARRAHRHGIKIHIFHRPQVTMSMRRERKEGIMRVFMTQAAAGVRLQLKGHVEHGFVSYNQGGHRYLSTNSLADTQNTYSELFKAYLKLIPDIDTALSKKIHKAYVTMRDTLFPELVKADGKFPKRERMKGN